MTDAEYNALIGHEASLWRDWIRVQALAKAAEAAWEDVNDALTKENTRRSAQLTAHVRARLQDRLAAERRGAQGAPEGGAA